MLFPKNITDNLISKLIALRDNASSAKPGSPVWWAFVCSSEPYSTYDITSPLPGVIVSTGLNMNNLISAMVDAYNDTQPDQPPEEFVDPSYDEEDAVRSLPLEDRLAYYRDTPSTYCVCDSPEQAVAYWQARAANPGRNYLILMTPIHRKPGNTGGWRWHKWGPYIGTQTPTCEYLDDEPEIEMVYVASIYELRQKTAEEAAAHAALQEKGELVVCRMWSTVKARD